MEPRIPLGNGGGILLPTLQADTDINFGRTPEIVLRRTHSARPSGVGHPIIFSNILQTGYQVTDAFWVGRLGASAVAAVSVSFPVTFLVIALGPGLAMAGATLTAQYMGAGRQDMVNHVAGQTMIMVAVTSVILGGLGYVLAPYLLELLGVAPDVYVGALGFMRVSFRNYFCFRLRNVPGFDARRRSNEDATRYRSRNGHPQLPLGSTLYFRMGTDTRARRHGSRPRHPCDTRAGGTAGHHYFSARAAWYPIVLAGACARPRLYPTRLFPRVPRVARYMLWSVIILAVASVPALVSRFRKSVGK